MDKCDNSMKENNSVVRILEITGVLVILAYASIHLSFYFYHNTSVSESCAKSYIPENSDIIYLNGSRLVFDVAFTLKNSDYLLWATGVDLNKIDGSRDVVIQEAFLGEIDFSNGVHLLPNKLTGAERWCSVDNSLNFYVVVRDDLAYAYGNVGTW